MDILPEPPAATAAGQAANPLTDAVMRAAVDNVIHELRRDSTSPSTPRREVPAMSARTTEITRSVMFCSLAAVPPGLIAVAVMVASEHANPTVIGMICAFPAVTALAVARLVRRAGEAAPVEINQTYTGPVHQDQRNVQSKTAGVWVRNTNEQ